MTTPRVSAASGFSVREPLLGPGREGRAHGRAGVPSSQGEDATPLSSGQSFARLTPSNGFDAPWWQVAQ
jgi:hypothetical protein